MTVRGLPCTSCRFYGIPCSVPMDKRDKLAKLMANEALEEATRIAGAGDGHQPSSSGAMASTKPASK